MLILVLFWALVFQGWAPAPVHENQKLFGLTLSDLET